ncbi:MAG: trk system potassium uptake protein TrkA [Myxococcota bacterium]|jgi:trk system potassium uptake protein TrkA
MYVLLAGNDEVALTIAESLMARHQVILIHPADWSSPRLDTLDIQHIPGRASAPNVLKSAAIDRCKVFVACGTNDEVNIVSCLAARHLGAERTICLLSRPGFFESDQNDDDLALYLGVDVVVRPWGQLATEIIQIITIPGALDVARLTDQLAVLRFAVEEGAPITRYPIKQTPLPRDAILTLLRRGEQLTIPNGDTHVQAGDKVTVLGTPAGVRAMLSEQLRVPAHRKQRHAATIVGGGVVGFLIAQGLEAAGWSARVIDNNLARCEEIAPLLPRTLVLHGDGCDMDLLEEEQVGADPVLVAVTNNDEKNLLVSMMARSLGVNRIITRADRMSNEKLFERVGVDVVRSAHGAAIRTVVRDIIDPRREIRAEFEHGDVEVLELTLPDSYIPIALMDIRTDLFTLVAAIVRGRETIIARGNTTLLPGDHLFVFCSPEDEEKSLALYLNPPRPAAD